MLITAARIAALAPHVHPDIADQLAGALQTAMPQFGVTDPLVCAHFMGQACWESQYFSRFEENLNYSHATAIAASWPRLAGRAADLVGKPQALANAAYAYRNGNGSENSGDGWTYRGRSIFMLSGRDNYSLAGGALGLPLVGNPDLAAQPQYAALTALWFWKTNRCGVPALIDDCDGVTRKINGPARAGLSNRLALTEQAKGIFV